MLNPETLIGATKVFFKKEVRKFIEYRVRDTKKLKLAENFKLLLRSYPHLSAITFSLTYISCLDFVVDKSGCFYS